jgi:hypothetical protein
MTERLKKYCILTAKILAVMLTLYCVLGIVITSFFGDGIKKWILSEINNNLATKVYVHGDIDLSSLSHFPYFSLTFNNVDIRESFPNSSKNLLHAGEVAVLFNVWDLIGKEYTFSQVIVSDGQLNVKRDSSGNYNYNIFKTSSANAAPVSIEIKKAELKNLDVFYSDTLNNQFLSSKLSNGIVSGTIQNDIIDLHLQTENHINFLLIDNDNYFANTDANLTGHFSYDTKREKATFDAMQVFVEKNTFNVSGTIDNSQPDETTLNLRSSGTDLDIHVLSQILPNDLGHFIRDYNSSGDLQYTATINGKMSSHENPSVNLLFGIENGELTSPLMKKKFENVNFTGKLNNGSARNFSTSTLSIQNVNATMDGRNIQLDLLLKDFNNRNFILNTNCELDLAAIYPLFRLKDITSMSGMAKLSPFHFEGSIREIVRDNNISSLRASGHVILEDVLVKTKNNEINKIRSDIELDDNSISIRPLSFHLGNSDFFVDGSIDNLIPYFLKSVSDSFQSRKRITIDLKMHSDKIDWQDIVGTATTPHSDTSTFIPKIVTGLSGELQASIGHFKNDRFTADNVTADLFFRNKIIALNPVDFDAEKGHISMQGEMNISDLTHIRMQSDITCKNLDIHELFYEFYDFDQKEITSDNLAGILNAQTHLDGKWNYSQFDYKTMHLVSDVTIDGGQLSNFSPLMAMSRFVKISDLQNIQFAKLHNQIEIQNGVIHVPQMVVNSNAMNLYISGTHTLDNIVNYNVKLNLLKLLTDKYKTNSSFNPKQTEVQPDGLFNLYLTIVGPADDPVIAYDKQAVKQQFNTAMKEEKSILKQTIKSETGGYQTMQTKDWKDQDLQEIQFQDSTSLTDPPQNNLQQSPKATNNKITGFGNLLKSLKKKTAVADTIPK